MESNNLTTHTYPTPTCTLIVANQQHQSSAPFQGQARNHNPVDFILHLEDPDRDGESITLQGQPQQLDRLQQVVSKYVAELVAKFPLPNTEDRMTSPPELADDVVHPANPDVDSPRSGLVKNLPGLRTDSTPPSPPGTSDNRSSVPPGSLVAKLFGHWNKQQPDRNSHPNNALDVSLPNPVNATAPTTPYLIGVGDRALDHQLHLGSLATVVSGEVLTLSAIQLFDLASVLEEYAAEAKSSPKSPQNPTLNRDDSIPEHGNRTKDVFATTTSLSRLPNLPKIPAAPAPVEHSPVYARTRRSRSSFMSAIPWAIASAIAVGVPLLLLDPKPNSFKDLTSKVKMPDLEGANKSDTTKLATQQSPKTSSNKTAGLPTVTSPTPWQAQPVRPPSVNKPLDSSISTSPNANKIGVAALPEALAGRSSGQIPATGSLDGNAANSVAPNPLLPSDINKLDNSITSATKSTPKASVPSSREAGTKTVSNNPKPATAPTKAKPATTTIGQLPIEDPNPPGKLSVSSQPMLTPPADLKPAISANPPNSPQAPLLPGPNLSGGIDPVEPQPQSPKKTTKSKAKPTTAATRKPQAKPSASSSQQPAFEPFTPVPRNPNLIDPEQNNNPQSSEPQPQPIVPNQPLPANTGNAAAPANNPSLEETKRYFQGKWKADNSQPNSLQYVVQVSGKSGVVRSVEPQGEAATAYLQQSKLIAPGQKLISPAAVGNNDQKIRVLLQPDGNVDTFVEP
jgi:hypothetical protein